jgi:predicted transcriptional regulator
MRFKYIYRTCKLPHAKSHEGMLLLRRRLADMKAQELDQDLEQDMLRMTADIVAAYVSANAVQTTQLPELIRSVIGALASLQGGASTGTPVSEPPQPPVPIRKSVTPDYIICLEDGRKLKMLKRHLRTSYNMSPADYRAKWGLPAEYPMVAPNYAARRSDFAKKIGLGRTAAERPKRRRAGH